MKLNKNTILAILLFALLVQSIIVSYNYFTGHIQIDNVANFITRIVIGTSFSFLFALLLVFLDLQIIIRLDIFFPLPHKLVARIPAELVLSVLAGVIVGSLVTIIAGTLMPYDDGLVKYNQQFSNNFGYKHYYYNCY
jgi:hypothetical protein